MKLKDLAKNSLSQERLYILLLALIQFAHIVDFVVLMPLGPTLMDFFDISSKQFSTLVSSYSFAAGISGFLYGLIADKFDRKNLLIWTFISFIIATIMCGLSSHFYFLLMARILTGCFGGILNGIVFAIITDLIPYYRRGKAMGIVISAFSFASVIGIPLGLMISDMFGWHKTFWFIALFSLPILILAWKIFPKMNNHINPSTKKEDLLRFIKLLSNTYYLKCFLFIFLITVSSFMIIPFIAPYAVENIKISKFDLKYIYLVGGLCTMISSQLIGKITDKLGAKQSFILLASISCLPIYFYTQATQMHLTSYLVLSTIFMVFVSGRFIPAMTMVSEIAQTQDRGSFMSLLNSIRAWASAIATLISGHIIVESVESSEISNFEHVGYISIIITIFSVLFAGLIHKILLKKLK